MAEKLAHRVRAVVRDLDEFTIDGLMEPLLIQSYEEKARVRSAIKGLKRAGEITSVKPGTYCYRPKEKPFSMLAKMWRGMLIKGTFTWRDIVILSGADKTHVHKYLVHLRKEGFIERISTNRSYEKGVYRLTDPDTAPLEHPHLPAKKKRKR